MSQTSTVEKPANTASIILGAENGGPLRHARAKIASTSVHYIAQLCKSPPRKSAESLEMWKLRWSVPSPSFVTTSINERHSTLFFLPPCLHRPRAGTSGRSKDLFASHQVPKNTKNNPTDCLTLGGIPCCAKKSYYRSLGHLWPVICSFLLASWWPLQQHLGC